MISKTYKLISIAALALAFGLLLSSAVSAQQSRLNPNNIQGYKNLYADLDGDGHTERVGLVENKFNRGGDPIYDIIVYNDRGKQIWRTNFSKGTYACVGFEWEPPTPLHCLLHDIDGDGNIELVISGWDDIEDALNGGRGPLYSPFWYWPEIFRWQHGEFTKLTNMSLNTSQGSDICRLDTSFDKKFQDYFRQHNRVPKYQETGLSVIHNLRKINGQVWGDILVDSSNEYPSVDLPSDVRLIKVSSRDRSRYYLYKTVRLETCPGGMRIVEYKQNH